MLDCKKALDKNKNAKEGDVIEVAILRDGKKIKKTMKISFVDAVKYRIKE